MYSVRRPRCVRGGHTFTAVVIAIAALACTSCAVNRSRLQPWRLVKLNGSQLLTPPDVARPDLTKRTIRVGVVRRPCRSPAESVIAIQFGKKHSRLTVERTTLTVQPRGWLKVWAAQLEAQGCVEAGEGLKLAEQIAHSLPLEPPAAFHLLYADDRRTGVVELGAHSRLQVVSPVLRDPRLGILAEGSETSSGGGYSLTVTGNSTDNLVGYETAFYMLRPRAPGIGYSIVPIYSERHADGKVERRERPTSNLFRFSPEAAFYAVIYKSWQTDFTALMIAARTPADLHGRLTTLETSGSADCENMETGMCLPIPRAVAVHPLISVTVNGLEVPVSRGATVLDAIRKSGERDADKVVARLRVSKPWRGRLARVVFDSGDTGILRLVLTGGEALSWTQPGPAGTD